MIGLYVHIPFCNKKCDYCDFVSYPKTSFKNCSNSFKTSQQNYLQNLLKEIDLTKNTYQQQTFNSIFIGGGTPSVMFDGFIKTLSQKLFCSFNFAKNTEFTIECNPKSLTENKLIEYISSGVNRISLGVQCLDDQVLKQVGRLQTKQHVFNAFKLLKKHNVKNINADVIIGLPNQTEKSVASTINYLINKTTHISVYGLQVEQNTPLFKNIKDKKLVPLEEDKTAKIFEKVQKTLKKHGFLQYEVSNFAKNGYQCRHNQKYWDGTFYLGLGVAAHSFVNNKRFFNTASLTQYSNKLNLNILPVEGQEILTPAQQQEEFIMLSLRTAKGLNLKEFKTKFKQDLLQTKRQQIKQLKDLDLITIKNNHLVINQNKIYVSNAIIAELI